MTIRAAVAERRCVFVAGIPGAGKSLVVHQAALIAREIGRRPHLLQWDVARVPFDSPAILARYPEIDSVTHAAIRLAVGVWSRGAVLRWHGERSDPREILIGETPLAGERLMELARPRDDAVEQLLAGDATMFLVPVPSRDVRRAIEEARARDMADPRRARDAKSAPPHLVSDHWRELERIARDLGIRARTGGAYDPDLYAEVYRRLLRHRRTAILPLDRILPLRALADEPAAGATEIVPSPGEVAAAMAEVERLPPGEIERRAVEWYRE